MKRFLFMCLTALCALTVWAYDFTEGGIYYNFNEDGSSVAVTWGGSSSTISGGTPEYTGNILIPETVEHEGVEYAVTTIGDHAFYDCAITGLTMLNNITSIEKNSIQSCKSLTAITIPSSVTSIGTSAFAGCTALTSITFPEGVTRIEESTCGTCSALEEVTIGSKVEYIGNNAFQSTSLKRFYSLNPTPPECYYLENPVRIQTPFYNTSIDECTLYVPIGAVDTYKETTVWEDFGSIEEMEDEGDDDGKFMVDGIYYELNSDGENTVKVTWGGSSSTISGGTPEYTGNILIPETVEHKGVEYAVTTIGDHAFYDCAITGLTMLNNITSIEKNSIQSCKSLTAITIPSSVTSIGTSAFAGCTALTSITFPEGVTRIEESTCGTCSALEEVTIGSKVEYIGNNAFQSTSLKRFYSLNPTPPECYYNVLPIRTQTPFYSTSIEECTLYVPIGSVDTYKETTVWEDFGSIEEIEEESSTDFFTISSVGYATYYTENEYTMPEGVTGSTVTGVGSQASDGGYYLTMPWEYESGKTVPAGTALVLEGNEGTYTYAITSTNATAATGNLLLGSTTSTETTGPNGETTGYVYYELTKGTDGTIGFYYGAVDGAAFTSAANKAWLALTTDQARGAKFLGFGDGDTTGISSVEANDGAKVSGIYTIQGVRVNDMSQSGIYIVDGKKVLVK